MKEKLHRNYGYIGPGTPNKRYYTNVGQSFCGVPIGILAMEAEKIGVPFFPGNVSNAGTYDFPVCFRPVPGTTQENVHLGDPAVLDAIIDSAKWLERSGCRAVVSCCGYFAHYQQEVAAAVDIPVYLSSVILLNWIDIALAPHQKIGVLCADGANFDARLMDACRIPQAVQDKCIIRGMEHTSEFQNVLADAANLDYGKMEQDMVKAACQLQEEHPDIGAILLECTEMPPFAAAVQAATDLPVYDFITMIKFVHSVVAQKPYYGFM